jgi:hypothetical protein
VISVALGCIKVVSKEIRKETIEVPRFVVISVGDAGIN